MSLSTPAYTATGSVNATDFVTDTNENNQLNPQKTFLETIDGFTRVATSVNYVITSNTQIVVYVDASGGARTITLPDCVSQYQSIVIKKIDTTYNWVTVQRAGSDTIEQIQSNALAPATTSDVIYCPNESRTYSPNGTQWRVESTNFNPKISFSASLSTAGLSATNTEDQLYYNVEDFDTAGFYVPGTGGTASRFTPLVPGYYQFTASIYYQAGTSAELIVNIAKNGAGVAQESRNSAGNEVVEKSKIIYLNGTSDYVSVNKRSATATRNILALARVTYFEGTFLHY